MKKKYYQISEIKENIYRFTSLENVFFELIVGTERALMIDTGYGFGDVRGAVRELTDRPLVVVNTHGHVDHTCGNYQFGEDIYLAPEDLDLLHRHNTKAFREYAVRLQEHAMSWETGQEVYGLPDDFDEQQYTAAAAAYADLPNYKPLKDGMVFDLGGKTIRAVTTPGHTRGSVSFYYEEENWLYVGDAANPFLWLFDKDAADRKTLVRTYDRILDLDPSRIYTGHIPFPVSTGDVKQFKRAALEADYDKGIPFTTPLMPDCTDIRVCILDGKTMQDIGTPGFYAILIDSSRKQFSEE